MASTDSSSIDTEAQRLSSSTGKETEEEPSESTPPEDARDKQPEDEESSTSKLRSLSLSEEASRNEQASKDEEASTDQTVAGDDVDTPEVSLKSGKLNEFVESSEASIKAVPVDENTLYASANTFEDLNLSRELLQALYSEMNFVRPSRIQSVTLPMILTPPYHHLIAQAQNGSGKTTCFVLGMLSRVDPALKAPQAICVCPTRELAIQNDEVLQKMAKFSGITSVRGISSYSANSNSSSRAKREQIVDQVVIGTPGTIKRWMSTKIMSTKHIKVLVFDEADHMLAQDGFQDDSTRIIKYIAQNSGGCQVLFFSATFNDQVREFTMKIAPKANTVFVNKEELSLDVIKQYHVKCPNESAKMSVLIDRIFPAAEKFGQAIIFVKTRSSARQLHDRLAAVRHTCTSIHGGMSFEDRDLVINEFRAGVTRILITTDVLARGFDQVQVTLVVNYDLPVKNEYPHEPDYELYLHRIGRSGRFGRKGAAFNLLANKRDEENLKKIERYFNRSIPEVTWDDDDAFETVLKDAGLA